jgi:hypothetical protein
MEAEVSLEGRRNLKCLCDITISFAGVQDTSEKIMKHQSESQGLTERMSFDKSEFKRRSFWRKLRGWVNWRVCTRIYANYIQMNGAHV